MRKPGLVFEAAPFGRGPGKGQGYSFGSFGLLGRQEGEGGGAGFRRKGGESPKKDLKKCLSITLMLTFRARGTGKLYLEPCSRAGNRGIPGCKNTELSICR